MTLACLMGCVFRGKVLHPLQSYRAKCSQQRMRPILPGMSAVAWPPQGRALLGAMPLAESTGLGVMLFWITLYADDMAVCEDSMQRLEALLSSCKRNCRIGACSLSTPKTKDVRICREQPSDVTLHFSQHEVEQAPLFSSLAAYKYTHEHQVRISSRLRSLLGCGLKVTLATGWGQSLYLVSC